MYRSIYILLFAIIVASGMASCSKIDDFRSQFGSSGTLFYPGKLDSARVFNGKNRVEIRGLFLSDPSITLIRVFWNNRHDSLSVPFQRKNGVDTVSIVVGQLPEGNISFEVRTYDAKGNVSIPVNVSGYVYGDQYQQSLLNRGISSAQLSWATDTTTINWADVGATDGGTKIRIQFADSLGMAHDTLIMPVQKGMVTMLPGYLRGSSFRYQTYILPDPTAIDTFAVPFDSVTPSNLYRERDITNRNTTFTFNYDDAGPAESAIRLVDSNYSTKYLLKTYYTDMYTQLQFPVPTVINAYTLTSGNDAPVRDPKNWNLAGSNDGITWTTLDTRVNQSFPNRTQTIKFVTDNSSAYTYYRLNITANNNDNTGLFQCTEWRLLQYY
ncbi:DUF4998 domain-containing protein [Niabella drilacis]|uniref:F5/8 type C domain-containing protein n=1 Tax=Niabella drilacis (strain DSM 25811 / CCM 8410 / CCUG 62505 / LMG 26954 / E90) TaxID=1285928 RepID=A0A1G6RLI6_NIADE|nr:DUF4998 domain-containing protein [Niabella drilacis]SDD05234.1 protein of unknown function [Niabella drilacis]